MCSSPEPGPAFQCLLMEADRQTAGRDCGFPQLAAPQAVGGLQRLQLACHTLQKPRDRCAQRGMLWCSFLPMRRGWRMLFTAVAVHTSRLVISEPCLHMKILPKCTWYCVYANIISVGLMPSSKKLFEFTRSQHLTLIIPKRVRYTASLSLWVFPLRKHSAPGNGDFFSLFSFSAFLPSNE